MKIFFVVALAVAVMLPSCMDQSDDAVAGIRNPETCNLETGYKKAICLLEAGKHEEAIRLMNELDQNGDRDAKEFLNDEPGLRKPR